MKSGTSIRSAFRMLLLSYSVPLHVLIPNEEKKLTYIFIFTLLCGASKRFVKAILIHLSEIHRAGSVDGCFPCVHGYARFHELL